MQNHIHTLVKQFFRKETLEEVSVDELQQFTNEYPYSAAGQVLLARKLQQTGDEHYDEQAERSTLYFSNPVWSRWLLQNHVQHSGPLPLEKISPREAVVPVTIVTPAEQPEIPVQENGTVHTASEPVVAEEISPTNGEQQHREERNEEPAAVETPVASVTPPAESNMLTADVTEEPAFEPYHTIDYFASQGIKLKLEDLPKDKLGQQLKSFTEWLKGMKRINPATDTNTLDEITHQAIQQIAEHSVAGKEIITEAMAEVWAKQGHREKAITIYEKLSLLNPAKSSYFAGKIEQLKAV